MLLKQRKAQLNSVAVSAVGKSEEYDDLEEIAYNKVPGEIDILTGNLSDKAKKALDKVLELDIESQRMYSDIITRTAEMRGKSCHKITLSDAQILPVLMSSPNPRLFLGDSPGLGKTIMSLGMYSYYMYRKMKQGREYKKVIVITEGNHVNGFEKEWKLFGVNLVPLSQGSTVIERTLKRLDIDEYDGVIINWDGIVTNGFLDFYLRNAERFEYIICDETSKIINPNNLLHIALDNIVNKYNGGISNCVFLNGSSYEKNIYDLYYQFKILKPKLIPSKTYLDKRYVIKGGATVHGMQFGGKSKQATNIIKKQLGEIIGYRNQDKFKESLKYYYIARSKKDYSDSLPENSYRLHGIEMTAKMKRELEDNQSSSLLNSPKTSDEEAVFTRKSHPKLDAVIKHVLQTIEDRPLIYVYNTESQHTIKELLEEEGLSVTILSGQTKQKQKSVEIDKFNNKEYDVMVFNLEKAMNIPSSDRIIFYDIPTMPQRTNQIKGRIDRNNYTDSKFYDFFCYLDSPEMINIVKLAYFREYHGNKFTGQYMNVYEELVGQLCKYYQSSALNEVQEIIDELYKKGKDDFSTIDEEVINALEESEIY